MEKSTFIEVTVMLRVDRELQQHEVQNLAVTIQSVAAVAARTTTGSGAESIRGEHRVHYSIVDAERLRFEGAIDVILAGAPLWQSSTKSETSSIMRRLVIVDVQLVTLAHDCGADARSDWLGEWSAVNPDRTWLETTVLRDGDRVVVPDAWVHREDGVQVPVALGGWLVAP